jgi:hypothetical protein
MCSGRRRDRGPSCFDFFAILQSEIHFHWADRHASTLKNDMAYTPTDCFETFPFPKCSNQRLAFLLEAAGESYYKNRRQVMVSRQEGLTQTYNRFHNPKDNAEDIQKLRDRHVEIDYAVAIAYGWHDLNLGHGFHEIKQGVRFTISEEARREVLGRLLKLNHERYAEEVKQGLHDQQSKRKKSGTNRGRRRSKLSSLSTLFDQSDVEDLLEEVLDDE